MGEQGESGSVRPERPDKVDFFGVFDAVVAMGQNPESGGRSYLETEDLIVFRSPKVHTEKFRKKF